MSDREQRTAAVDPHRSVIVQAPAGSGKTTLLVERYLGLLATVDEPEEVLAITFTRKAAAEMQQRVLHYLNPELRSNEAHEQAPLAKARAVAKRVARWNVTANPRRLLIRTIDSFNFHLARTMPVASQLGPVPGPAEHTQALYRQAVRTVLDLIETDDELANDLQGLLRWRDNRSQDIENLLVSLLARREQWLRALGIGGAPERARLEAVLEAVVGQQLRDAAAALNTALRGAGSTWDELAQLLRFAATTLQNANRASAIQSCTDLEGEPDATAAALSTWAGVAEALLVQTGAIRISASITIGFPPKTPQKARFVELLQSFAGQDQLTTTLDRARRLPQPHYSDAEWRVLAALVRVLKRAATELELVFASTGQTDFAGLAWAALRGLGDETTGYTDLGLYLDRRIKHILVDEFQDTNFAQLRLLEKLTAGWQPGDGRSLFLVGDPMQSIYRFREAEVGLFIRSRDAGIGALAPEPLRLTRNFRSRAEIVGWVNNTLGPIFADTEDIASGAVAYAPSEAGRDAGGRIEVVARADPAAEAEAIAALIARSISENVSKSDFKAAILVRARGHLAEILPALRRHNIAYRAVKLDPLTARPVVQDLLALTRAIINPADTTATLAVLRSPVCGLTLAELHALAGDGGDLADRDCASRLTGDARLRAESVFDALHAAQALWRRRGARDLVEGAWHRLGGPACVGKPATDLNDAALYLDALETADTQGLLNDWNDFEELLADQFTQGDPPSDAVKLEILTMHGAKGLEWDLVVLPGLNRRGNNADRDLLYWLPFTAASGDEQVLLAPLRNAAADTNPPLVELIRAEQNSRDAFEMQRLLYVAATRAREHLVLTACLDPVRDEIKPAAGSLLAQLWPTAAAAFTDALRASSSAATPPAAHALPDQSLRRIASGWRPVHAETLAWQPPLAPHERSIEVEFNWAGVDARRNGTVLHRLLERAGTIGVENLDAAQRAQLIDRIPQLLQSMGGTGDALNRSAEIIRRAFDETLDNDTGKWLLSNRHSQAGCELALAGILDGQLINAVVDRTFIDADGVRWIIDYKSGYHAGGDLEGFLAEEAQRYQAQLTLYRRLFQQLGESNIKTALYLPRHSRLHVVDAV